MSRAPEGSAVVFVDAEPMNRKVVEANFKDRYPLRFAASAEQALELLAREEVAVVLADERLPDMRGTELLGLVKERFPDVMRLLVTDVASLAAATVALNRGAVWRYVVEPWDAQSLADVIDGARDVYRLTRERNGLQVQLLLAERRAMLGLFAGSIGHELNNALSASLAGHTVLQSIASVFGRCVEAALAEPRSPAVARLLEEIDLQSELEECNAGLQQMKESLQQVAAIAQQMVEGMKPRAMQMRPVDVSALAHSVARLTQHHLLMLGAKLRTDIEPNLVARADSLAVRQILTNLLANAAQSMPPERGASEVTLTATRSGDQILLRVGDSGAGIPPANLERIFEPLFTTRGDDGTGLGLPISRELAVALGGELSVESVVGEGSVFTLRLAAALEP